MKLRKINRVIHRDLGYFFTGMVLIYCISGIALNHLHQWNPNYIITKIEFTIDAPIDADTVNDEYIKTILESQGERELLSFYFPREGTMKAFIRNGTATFNLTSGDVVIEKIRRRPLFNQLNFLHYNNPRKVWTAISDIFAVSLIIVTITGLFIIKGQNGITRRGALLVIAGIVLPIVILLIYFQ